VEVEVSSPLKQKGSGGKGQKTAGSGAHVGKNIKNKTEKNTTRQAETFLQKKIGDALRQITYLYLEDSRKKSIELN